MVPSRLAVFIAALLVLSTSPSFAAAPDDALALIGTYAQQMMSSTHAPGLSVAVTDRAHTIKIFSLGLADVQSHTPVIETTRFGIGSISKSMTATALLLARDRGVFDPSAPVTKYLPWFRVKSPYRPISGFDLLTHTSGLPDGGTGSSVYDVYALRNETVGYAPGEHWSYSNVGYETLGAILQTVEGTQYSDTLAKRIFQPLGMVDSSGIWTPETLATAATGYMYAYDDRPEPESYPLIAFPQTTFADPAGSVVSTAGDMAKYLRFILNAQLLSPESYKLLTTASVKNGKTEAGLTGFYDHYAFGLAQQTVDGHHLVGHTGGVSRNTSCFQADLDSGFAVIAMSNLGYVGPRPCAVVAYALKVLRAKSEGEPLPPVPAPADPLHVDGASAYAGTYRSQDGETLAFVAKNDHLRLENGAASETMSERGGDQFWVDDPRFAQYTMRFIRDKDKHVTQMAHGSKVYSTAAYVGPTQFTHPKEWDAYEGTYRDATSFAFGGEAHVLIVKDQLVLEDGTQLVPLGNGVFRVGTDDWSPERVTFSTIVNGVAQRAIFSAGPTLYRTFAQ
ncbi:MAG: serine hydrolase [Candidatus Eremiobacteraeota bacterium]|nr:serine hydrolase [Candidatus Eremiobacteraeota bacterium]